MQKLVFDNSASAEDLVNFTVLVHLNSSIIDWDDFQVNGDDIRFIDEDYETYLDYEVETWNHGYDAWIWVEVPQIDSSSAIDHIYMYYDNPHATSGENKEGTWNNDYVMVQHMVDETNASILDSTQYDNDGVKGGVNEPIETTDGQIDSAQEFDGSNDYINCGSDVSLNGLRQYYTLETWIYIIEFPDTGIKGVLSKRWFTGFQLGIRHEHKVLFSTQTAGGNNDLFSTVLPENSWYHVVATFQVNTSMKLYINGVLNNSLIPNNGDIINHDAHDFWIGKQTATTNYYNGTIDEVRVYNVTKSADWIETQYLSMTEDYITYKELSLCETKSNIFPLVLIALFVIIGIVVVSRT